MTTAVTTRLFIYGTLLRGEPDHDVLRGAELVGTARTERGFTLVEARAIAGLVQSGDGDVVGEIYDAPYETFRAHEAKFPALFERREIRLADGTTAQAFLLSQDQARGLRRIRGGDWRQRFATTKPEPGALVRWAKDRNRRG
jgi:gamma-glutamylcyclotransferase (GGCT)/AIG2-like uncharacterized protein YtfP